MLVPACGLPGPSQERGLETGDASASACSSSPGMRVLRVGGCYIQFSLFRKIEDLNHKRTVLVSSASKSQSAYGGYPHSNVMALIGLWGV